MEDINITTKIGDLPQDKQWRIAISIFRNQGSPARKMVLLMKRRTCYSPEGTWQIPVLRPDDSDTTIGDAIRRYIAEQTGLRGIDIIEQAEPLGWSWGGRAYIQLNFGVRDRSVSLVSINPDRYIDYRWVRLSHLRWFEIPSTTKEVIQGASRIESIWY
ncbi:uncharacterized protein N7515_005551 [Penicillium bovifimosum]|uniref:Nudix hydrolase domain-containing protein n=1 Tax=Penicillium bovifimosum TaxID=126998 RepID=A0A9W9L0B0_9EURO|nr:uncharacterized protein N7515_005551 [Penicillium bovifimosum]KAJ5129512.1 hypothetical protein N7515_005551 [Penicillium bovifimosum]